MAGNGVGAGNQDFTKLGKSRVSRAVQRLAVAGLVQKKTREVDARLVEIALTQAGHQALSEIVPVASEVETRLLADLPREGLVTFYGVLEHLPGVLHKDPKAKQKPPSRETD